MFWIQAINIPNAWFIPPNTPGLTPANHCRRKACYYICFFLLSLGVDSFEYATVLRHHLAWLPGSSARARLSFRLAVRMLWNI
jgi:hypothetical protein